MSRRACNLFHALFHASTDSHELLPANDPIDPSARSYGPSARRNRLHTDADVIAGFGKTRRASAGWTGDDAPGTRENAKERAMTKNTALVRRPSPLLTQGVVTHVKRQPVDVTRALRQWQGYVDALAANGWTIIEVPPADDCPDGVFIEDALVMYGHVAVITRPGHVDRRAETATVESVAAALGCTIERITAPGTLDGGDVLKVGPTVYVGRGGRTNDAGIQQLRTVLQPHGATVVVVPLSKVLHLKSAVTALPDGTIIGWMDAIDDPAVFPNFVAMPEESGAHVVLLDDDRLLMAADAPRSAELLRARGYHPVTVDISEFVKLEGCVTCLSVRLRQPQAAVTASASEIPADGADR